MQDYPEIQNYTRLRTAGKVLFRNDDAQVYEDDLYYADSSMFNVTEVLGLQYWIKAGFEWVGESSGLTHSHSGCVTLSQLHTFPLCE